MCLSLGASWACAPQRVRTPSVVGFRDKEGRTKRCYNPSRREGAPCSGWITGLTYEQTLVESDFENAGDHILCLPSSVTVVTANPESTDAHVSYRLGNNFVGDTIAGIADQVLVSIVGWTNETSLDMDGVAAPTPWAWVTRGLIARLVATRRRWILPALAATLRTHDRPTPLHSPSAPAPSRFQSPMVHQAPNLNRSHRSSTNSKRPVIDTSRGCNGGRFGRLAPSLRKVQQGHCTNNRLASETRFSRPAA